MTLSPCSPQRNDHTPSWGRLGEGELAGISQSGISRAQEGVWKFLCQQEGEGETGGGPSRVQPGGGMLEARGGFPQKGFLRSGGRQEEKTA